jgi:hypothetical protein
MSDLLVAGGLSGRATKIANSINAALDICAQYMPIVDGRYFINNIVYGTSSISAPTSPYIVTHGGSPAGCVLDLYDDETRMLVATTKADPTTGAFSFTGLSNTRTFSVVARGSAFSPSENDQILAGITPG